jgi:hypothetical protein
MFTTYHLTREGELLGLEFKGKMDLLNEYHPEAQFQGEVRDGKLYRSGWIKLFATSEPVVPELEPVDAPTGTFLNPLHPVPRIKGLTPGRRWRMQVVNPLADAVEPSLRAIQQRVLPGSAPVKLNLASGPKYLNAEVLPNPVTLPYNGKDHECFVIEYRGDNEVLRTYVRVADGLVLRQESEAMGEKFVLQRA